MVTNGWPARILVDILFCRTIALFCRAIVLNRQRAQASVSASLTGRRLRIGNDFLKQFGFSGEKSYAQFYRPMPANQLRRF